MEKKDFPKGTKPREIFVYTCERIAEPLIPLGYKYRKSKNDIYKKDGIFVYDDFPRYEVSTLLERERSIQEISGQIQDYALPFFARFSDLPKLLDDVEREGFFPHRKGFDVPKRNREFIECFREYLKKT